MRNLKNWEKTTGGLPGSEACGDGVRLDEIQAIVDETGTKKCLQMNTFQKAEQWVGHTRSEHRIPQAVGAMARETDAKDLK